ncbi:hypothetical protein ACFE04_013980 [Oxalis oulophora]
MDVNNARRIIERELHQIEQIRLLESEELLVEEVDNDHNDDDSSSDGDLRATGAAEEFTFDTSLASLHTYLGEVDDTSHRLSFLNGGAILILPLFYIEGVVLFPEATLPLRVIRANFIAAVERALSENSSLVVVRAFQDYSNGKRRLARIGTTAKIRQYRRLEDGSMNVLTRGEQRFRLRRYWFDVEGVPLAEVQIIDEDSPLRSPREVRSHRLSHKPSKNALPFSHDDGDSDSEVNSDDSFESELSLSEKRVHRSAIRSMDGTTSSDDYEKQIPKFGLGVCKSSMSGKVFQRSEVSKRRKTSTDLNQLRKTPCTFWPHWVYRMYDSYSLAQRAADKGINAVPLYYGQMGKEVVKSPSMEGFVNNPNLLSFYIASKIPVSESVRQELLEIDGISYRLQREIELLESFDRVRCRTCKGVIAKRSDMLMMSNDGPLGAYVNPGGFVFEIMTLHQANGLALIGTPVREYSWFPGYKLQFSASFPFSDAALVQYLLIRYAWTIATCTTCEIQMGWLFSATNKKLKPRSFWGIRSSQVADEKR